MFKYGMKKLVQEDGAIIHNLKRTGQFLPHLDINMGNLWVSMSSSTTLSSYERSSSTDTEGSDGGVGARGCGGGLGGGLPTGMSDSLISPPPLR